MTTIVLTEDNFTLTENGGVEIGSRSFGRSDNMTYQVYLKAAAVALIDPMPGDKISWHRTDGDLPCYGVAGELQKADGRRFQLEGTGDAGVHTGYPPRLGLKFVQASRLTWETLSSERIVRELRSGNVFRDTSNWMKALGDLSLSDLREELELDSLPPLPLGERWKVVWDEKIPHGSTTMEDFYGFHKGYLLRQQKTISEVSTELPLVLY